MYTKSFHQQNESQQGKKNDLTNFLISKEQRKELEHMFSMNVGHTSQYTMHKPVNAPV